VEDTGAEELDRTMKKKRSNKIMHMNKQRLRKKLLQLLQVKKKGKRKN
jgi:hypothetical protein